MDIRIDPEQIRPLAEKLGVEFIVLHGSHATGKMHGQSDLDIAFECAHTLAFDELGELYAFLFNALRPNCEIDLVDLYNADPVLKFQVASKGIPLYEVQPGTFREFQVYTSNEYADTQIMRDQVKTYLRDQYHGT